MKKYGFLSALALGLAFVSCSQVEVPAGSALFDNFVYEGHDKFYAENPLPGDDYYYNPVLAGWYSDPSMCTNGKGDYFIVTSSFTYYPGVPIFHSRDLVNWKQIGHVLNRPEQLVNFDRQHVSGGIFAPAIEYNPANETYYMVTTNVGAGNFYVKTKDPFAGEWSDPIMLPEVLGIDPSFFFDDDGKAYIINNDDAPGYKPEYDGHRTLRVVEFDVENDCTVGERRIVLNKGVRPEEKPIWIEGPHIYKINGKYYIMSAEGGTSLQHSEVILRGDSVWGPYEPWDGNPILTQRHMSPDRENPVTCAGHADMLQDPNGNWWAIFLACRPYDQDLENLGRETFMMPVEWTEDGWPIITKPNEQVPMIVQFPGVKRDENVTFGNFTVADDFNAQTLGMEWMTLRSAGTDLYSLSEVPGFFKLSCSPERASARTTPALILRRIHHHEFTAKTTMYFNPVDTEAAGMLLFKDETHHFFLKVYQQDGARMVAVEKISATGRGRQMEIKSEVLASAALPDCKSVDLQVSSDGPTFSFSFAPDGKNMKVLKDGVSADYLTTAKAGGFTGTTVGLYAIK